MSIEIVKKFYEHAAAGRFVEALDLFAKDAEIIFSGPSSIPMSGHFRGIEQIQRFFGIVGTYLDVQYFAPEKFVDGGDVIAVAGRERSLVKSTSLVFDVPWVQLWTIKDEKIYSLTDYFETDSMARAFEGRL